VTAALAILALLLLALVGPTCWSIYRYDRDEPQTAATAEQLARAAAVVEVSEAWMEAGHEVPYAMDIIALGHDLAAIQALPEREPGEVEW
jgi:hypothetical protein